MKQTEKNNKEMNVNYNKIWASVNLQPGEWGWIRCVGLEI